jgi:hypothetical protein
MTRKRKTQRAAKASYAKNTQLKLKFKVDPPIKTGDQPSVGCVLSCPDRGRGRT